MNPERRQWVSVCALGLLALVPLAGHLFFGYGTVENVIEMIRNSGSSFWNGTKNSPTNTTARMVYLNPLWLALGLLSLPFFADNLGRKKCLILALVSTAAAHLFTTVGAFSNANWLPLCVGRAVLWFSFSLVVNTLAIWTVEIAFNEIRGALGAVGALFLAIGNTWGYTFALDDALGLTENWYFGFLAFFLLSSLGIVVTMVGLKESPFYHFLWRNDGAAENSLEFYWGIDSRLETLHEEVEDLELIEELPSDRNFADFSSVFVERTLRRLILAGIAVSLASCSSHIVLVISPALFAVTKLEISWAIKATLLLHCISIFGCLSGIYLIEFMGRRFLIWVGTIFSAASWAAITILFIATKSSYAAVFLLFFCQVALAFGIEPVHWILLAELFPLRHRANGVLVSRLPAALLFAGEICIFYYFQPNCTTSPWFYGALAAQQFLAFILTHFFLIETSGKSHVEIYAEISGDNTFMRELRRGRAEPAELVPGRGRYAQPIRPRRISASLGSLATGRRSRHSSFVSLEEDFEKDLARARQIVPNNSEFYVKKPQKPKGKPKRLRSSPAENGYAGQRDWSSAHEIQAYAHDDDDVDDGDESVREWLTNSFPGPAVNHHHMDGVADKSHSIEAVARERAQKQR